MILCLHRWKLWIEFDGPDVAQTVHLFVSTLASLIADHCKRVTSHDAYCPVLINTIYLQKLILAICRENATILARSELTVLLGALARRPFDVWAKK